MGYLAQKKKNARESTFLKWMLTIFIILTLLILVFEKDSFLRTWLFQVYVLNVVVFLYALSIGRILYGLGLAT